MEIKGIHQRTITNTLHDVLVIQPSDEGNKGGYFTSFFKGEKVWGQEIWLADSGRISVAELTCDFDWVKENLLESRWAGHIAIKSNGPYRLILGTQRDEIVQPHHILTGNVVIEHGPSVEQEKIEA